MNTRMFYMYTVWLCTNAATNTSSPAVGAARSLLIWMEVSDDALG